MERTVRALFVCPEKKARPLAVAEVQVSSSGFQGDFHSRTANRRQILMLSSDVLRAFEVSPGTLFENIVIEGIDVMSLSPGQRLHIGDSVLEVTVPCEPCVQMERVRKGLKQALQGKRGMFAQVVTPGTIRIGDTVTLS
jgi:MOSC domain-containing protein YiiM